MIQAIIFDCFGVLAGGSFKEIYRQAGGNLEKDIGFIDDTLTATNSGFITTQEMHQRVARRLGMSSKEWTSFIQKREQPNEELINYIHHLHYDYKTAVLSNANFGVLERTFNPRQLAAFDVLTVSAEAGSAKPDAQIYILTAQRLGVMPMECVFTDDSQLYCEAAKEVGMKAIWYQNLGQFKNELEQLLRAQKV